MIRSDSAGETSPLPPEDYSDWPYTPSIIECGLQFLRSLDSQDLGQLLRELPAPASEIGPHSHTTYARLLIARVLREREQAA